MVEVPFWEVGVVGGASVIVFIGLLVYLTRLAIISAKTLLTLQEMHPVVMDLARQFKNDSGSSALDMIQKISTATKEAALVAADAKVTAADANRSALSLQRAIDLLTIQQQRLEDTVHYAAEKTTQTMNLVQALPQGMVRQGGVEIAGESRVDVGRDMVAGDESIGGHSISGG